MKRRQLTDGRSNEWPVQEESMSKSVNPKKFAKKGQFTLDYIFWSVGNWRMAVQMSSLFKKNLCQKVWTQKNSLKRVSLHLTIFFEASAIDGWPFKWVVCSRRYQQWITFMTSCFFATAGHFGCVYRGFMRRDDEKEETEVAIKTLKSLSGNTPIFSSNVSKYNKQESLS